MSALQHGTEEQHRATLRRARDAGVDYIRSEAIRDNPRFAESLRFGVANKLLETEWVEYELSNGWKIKWL